MRLRPGLCPGSHSGVHAALPNPLIWWERTPLANLHPTIENGRNLYVLRQNVAYNVQKCVCGWGFAPEPTGELTTLPTPTRLRRGHPRQTPSHSAPSASQIGSAPLHIISGYVIADNRKHAEKDDALMKRISHIITLTPSLMTINDKTANNAAIQTWTY